MEKIKEKILRTTKKNIGIFVGAFLFVIVSGYVFRDKIPFFSASAGNAPVAYWTFDEGVGSTAFDSSGTNNGTLGSGNSAPTWISNDQCISGKCLNFDGTNDYVNAGTGLTNLSAITVSAWIKAKSIGASSNRIIDKSAGAPLTKGWFVSLNPTNAIIFDLDTDSANLDRKSANNVISLNSWQYITVVWDGTGITQSTVKIYVNGKEVAYASGTDGTGTRTDDTGAFVGIGDVVSGSTRRPFDGYMDEVKVYNYARTTSQIQADFTARGSVKGVSAQFGNTGSTKKLSDGLIGYWKMDEAVGTTGSSWTALDSSGNNNNATGAADAGTTGGGKYGNGGGFDGNGDYLSISDRGSTDILRMNGVTSYTLAGWIKVSDLSASTQHFIVSKYDFSGQVGYSLLVNSTGTIRFDVNGNQNAKTTTAAPIAAGSWYHIVGVFRNGNIMEVYVNGSLLQSWNINSTSLTAYTGSFGIGSPSNNLGNDTFTTAGILDEVRVYNRALDSSEVRALYQYAPGPVGYWKFDESSGTTAKDNSGNGNNGTWNGSGIHMKIGKYGNAGSFDGTSDYVNVPYNSVLNTPFSFTLSAWFKTTSTNRADIVDRYGSSPFPGYGLVIKPTANCGSTAGQVSVWVGDATNNFVCTTTTYNDGQWHYATGMYDGTTAYIYVDGVLQNSAPRTASLSNTSTALKIGAISDISSPNYLGQIDDVKLYNYARTPSQIIEDMNGGHPAVGTPVGSTVGYWKFDEGYGSTAYDSSPQGNNANFASGTAAPSWTNDGKFKKALSFDGTADYVDLGDPASNIFDFSGVDYSIGFWLNTTASGVDRDILSKRSTCGHSNFYAVAISSTGKIGGEVDQDASGTNYNAFTSNTAVNNGLWHHAAIVRSGATIYVYIDSKLDSTTTGAGIASLANSSPLQIGRSVCSGVSTQRFLGKLDEFKVYPFALTADQVKVDYNRGKAQTLGATSTGLGGTSPDNSSSRSYCVPGDSSTCSAPSGEWLFNQTVGTSAPDTSTNGNTGTLTNGPVWYGGKVGNGLSFDGVDDYVLVSSSGSFTNSALAVSAWVKPNNVSGSTAIVSKRFGHNEWMLWLNGANPTFRMYLSGSGPLGTQVACSTYPAVANNWIYITGVWDGSTPIIYVNGKYCATGLAEGTPASISAPVTFGSDTGGGAFLNGVLDNVRFYNYARTSAQIAWEYNQGAPVAYYNFRECTGTTLYDESENANGGTNGNNGTILIGSSGTQTSAGTCTDGNSAHAWNNGATGKYGSSLNFDSTDDYVNLGTTNLPSGTGAQWSITAWAKVGSLPVASPAHIASIGNGVTGQSAFIAVSSGGSGFMVSTWGGTNDLVGNTPVIAGRWYYVAGLSDGTNLRLYVNGILDANPKSVTNNLNPVRFRIGADTGSTAGEMFNGQIDDVKIFNYALTPAQVKTEMLGGAVRYQ